MTQAARVIQDAWRRYHTRRNSTRSTGEIDSSLPQPQGETETIVEEPEFNIT